MNRVSFDECENVIAAVREAEGFKIDPRLVRRAVNETLTDKQRAYAQEYYFLGMSMPRIAEKHGVSVSTVSRTLERARRRIYRVMRFCGGRM